MTSRALWRLSAATQLTDLATPATSLATPATIRPLRRYDDLSPDRRTAVVWRSPYPAKDPSSDATLDTRARVLLPGSGLRRVGVQADGCSRKLGKLLHARKQASGQVASSEGRLHVERGECGLAVGQLPAHG